jgi:hypothetical protein
MCVYFLQNMFYSQYIMTYSVEYTEEFEDTKGVTRIVYRRRTDNTMAKRKRTNNDLLHIHIKQKIK